MLGDSFSLPPELEPDIDNPHFSIEWEAGSIEWFDEIQKTGDDFSLKDEEPTKDLTGPTAGVSFA